MATHVHASRSIPGAGMTKYSHLRKELPRSICRHVSLSHPSRPSCKRGMLFGGPTMQGSCAAWSCTSIDFRWLCRAAAETESKPGASSNGAEPRLQRTDSGREARQAVAAKISAARALARRLSEEKQAAMLAARLAAEHAMNEEEIDRCVIGLRHAVGSPAQRIHAAVRLVGGRLGHTQRGLSAGQQCLPAVCRQCVDVHCVKPNAAVCAEFDSLSRLPQQMQPRRWRGQMLWPGLPSGLRALDPA